MAAYHDGLTECERTMTPDERAKRIHDITYSTADREEIAERMVELEDERDKLKAERDYLWMNANPTAYELRTVRAQWKKDRDENAKLRELCADFVRQIKLAEYFDCFGGKCEKWGECHGECVFERRARELGIEVD